MLAADFPDWAGAVGVPLWIGGLGFLLWLWLSGRVMRTADHQAALAAERQRADEQVEAAELRVADLLSRVEHLSADCDAWREAHNEQAAARAAQERVTAALMESTNISVALLSALKDALAGPPAR